MKRKLGLDKTFGPAPNKDGLYKSAFQWVRMTRPFQWTQGYDVDISSHVENEYTTLSCATDPNCTFSITALYHHFDDPSDGPDVFGQYGFRISSSRPTDLKPFNPLHSHDPVYLPVVLEQENAYRTKLGSGGAALVQNLERPRFIPVQPNKGFASEDTPFSEDMLRETVSKCGASGSENSTRPRKRCRSSSPMTRVKSECMSASRSRPESPSSPREPRPREPQTSSRSPEEARSSVLSGSSSTRPVQVPSRTTIAKANDPYPENPRPPRALDSTPTVGPPTPLSTPASVPRTPSVDTSLAQTPLGSFLVEISPIFLSILPHLARNEIPLETDPRELISLDTNDSTIWDLFESVEGATIAHCALAAEGVRKAKTRMMGLNHDEALSTKLNPQIVIGLQKARVNNWVRSKIATGETILGRQQAS